MYYKRVLFHRESGKRWLVANLENPYSCSLGSVSVEELQKTNGTVQTNTGKELFIWEATFYDNFSKLKRGPALVISKDIGAIVAHTLPNSGTIIDGGAGTGALACALAYLFPNSKVISYERREEHLKIANKNKENLDLDNVEFKLGDLADATETDFDLMTVDMPEPQNVLGAADKLKPGCFMVSYLPCITQVQALVESLPDNFYHFKTMEVTEREWNVQGRKVRPKPVSIGHTAFLVFIRKLK